MNNGLLQILFGWPSYAGCFSLDVNEVVVLILFPEAFNADFVCHIVKDGVLFFV